MSYLECNLLNNHKEESKNYFKTPADKITEPMELDTFSKKIKFIIGSLLYKSTDSCMDTVPCSGTYDYYKRINLYEMNYGNTMIQNREGRQREIVNLDSLTYDFSLIIISNR